MKTTAVDPAAEPGRKGLLFPHAAQAVKVTRTRTPRNRAKTRWKTETVYAVTSLSAPDATGEQTARTRQADKNL